MCFLYPTLYIKKNKEKSLQDRFQILKQSLCQVQKLTDSPSASPRSAATLSETAMADIRLGCVQIILQEAPRAASISDSKMY